MANRTTQRVEQRKSRILVVAKDILIRKGRQTKMADIARASDLETSSLYYYFKGVPDVLNALLADQYRDLKVHETELSTRNLSCLEILGEMIRYLLEFYHENFDLVQIILGHVSPLFQDPELEEESEAINDFLAAYRRADSLLLEYLENAQAAGELPEDLAAGTMLALARGAMFGVVSSWRENKPTKDSIPLYVERILGLIG